jgi:hypothetical protein
MRSLHDLSILFSSETPIANIRTKNDKTNIDKTAVEKVVETNIHLFENKKLENLPFIETKKDDKTEQEQIDEGLVDWEYIYNRLYSEFKVKFD